MARGNLRGPRAKIARAEHHLADLATAVDTWGASETEDHRPTTNYDPEGNRLKIFLEKVAPEDLRFAVLVGDVVHNLRSALDHLACQLAIVSCRPASCCKHTAFPICIDESSFASASTKIEPFVRPEMFTLIQEIQPYIAAHVRGLPIKSSNLAIISQLDIIDKHRMLVVAGKHYRVTHLSYRINESKSIEVPHSIAWRPLEEGAQIGEINLGSHVPKREDKVRVKAHTEAQIVFDETGYACDGLEVIGALQACISYVTAIVDEFELRFFTK